MKLETVIFFADYNLSTPDGPGINESCLIKELSKKLGVGNVIVFSRGNHGLPCTFFELSGSQKLSLSYLWGSWKNFRTFRRVVSSHPQAIVVMRQLGIGVPEFLFSLAGGRYVLKTSLGRIDRYKCFFLYQ
ncbi:MAG: hypothetical protein LBD15_00945, partial [Holosporales bacterium]|nr:hypothetical protein [Holosporales bacterium]